MEHVSKGFTRRNSEVIQRLRRQISSGSRLSLQEHKNDLFRVKNRLLVGSTQYLKDSRNSLESMEQLVKLVDPIHVLQRGYSITTKDGKTVSKSNSVKEGDTITTRTANFTLTSKVLKKEDDV